MRTRGNPLRMTARFALRRWLNLVLDWLYPDGNQTCLLCHRPLPHLQDLHTGAFTKIEPPLPGLKINQRANIIPGVCPFCLQDAVTLYQQESSVRLLRVPVSENRLSSVESVSKAHPIKLSVQVVPVFAAAVYDGLVRTAIRQWKYDGTIEFTKWFAKWVAAAYAAQVGAPWQPDVLVPVPSSEDRFRKRGYNHVLLLADSLSQEISTPVHSVLMRHSSAELGSGKDAGGFTQSQTAKNARERLQGLEGAYVVRNGANVKGKSLLLLDDIVTTGSTLYTCAKALYEAGAKQVMAVVIAEVK